MKRLPPDLFKGMSQERGDGYFATGTGRFGQSTDFLRRAQFAVVHAACGLAYADGFRVKVNMTPFECTHFADAHARTQSQENADVAGGRVFREVAQQGAVIL